MRFKNDLLVFCVMALVLSCKEQNDTKEQVSGTEAEVAKPEASLTFPKGDKITNDNFTGTAYVSMLVGADSLNPMYAGNVTFEPGARTNWHSHPSGQIILVIDGEGYYQEKGSPKRILKKGDAVKCPPNLPHWHGASTDSEFVQLAISSRENGPTQWLKPVTEEEYLK